MKTLIEALPENNFGIISPFIHIDAEGNKYEVYIRPASIKAMFPCYCNLPVPLTEAEYRSLLLKSDCKWQQIWQAWRLTGVI